MASGSYVLATYFHFSAPIATVIAGLVISKDIDVIFKQETIKEQVHLFWEFIDEFLSSEERKNHYKYMFNKIFI